MEQYDYVIIGGGIGGLMCAYRLAEKKPDSVNTSKANPMTGKSALTFSMTSLMLMNGALSPSPLSRVQA